MSAGENPYEAPPGYYGAGAGAGAQGYGGPGPGLGPGPGAAPPPSASPLGAALAAGVPPPYGLALSTSSSTVKGYEGGKIVYDGKWRDLWAAILFYLHLAAVLGLAVYLGIRGLSYKDVQDSFDQLNPHPSPPPAPPNSPPFYAPGPISISSYSFADWAPQLVVGSLVSIAFGFVWIQLIKLIPKVMVWVSLLFCFVLFLLSGIAFLFAHTESSYIYAAVFFAGALIQILYIFLIRHRIPFAAALLKGSTHIVRLFPSVLWVAYLALLLSLLWTAVWILALSGAMSLSQAALMAFLLLLSYYWTSEVIRNVVHVTTSGTVATFYYYRASLPPNPTGKSLYRATTTSFGSICLGSLLVAIVQTLKAMVQSAANSDDNEILRLCALCILSCLEAIIEFFNKYAYIQIAIYGKPFFQAAKDTWQLLRARGIDLLVNDDLTGSVLGLGCLIGAALSGLAAGMMEWGRDPYLVGSVALFSFLLGFLIVSVPLTVVDSTVGTLYVCFAEDPQYLQRDDPVLYAELTGRMAQINAR